MNRRDFLKTTGIALAALAAMCMGCGSSSATSAPTAATTVNEGAKQVMDSKTGKKILIAYYSYSGNTKALAEEIHRQAGGDLIPIVPEVPYSETYDVTVARAKQEQQSNARPAIKTAIPNMEQYDMVLLGYPNWWGSYPMLIATFAEKCNLDGKKLLPSLPMAAEVNSVVPAIYAGCCPRPTFKKAYACPVTVHAVLKERLAHG